MRLPLFSVWFAAGCDADGDSHADTDVDTVTATDTATDPATTGSCQPAPLPDGWGLLTLSAFGDIDLSPGATRDLDVQAIVFGTPQPLDLCELWSVAPADAGVTVDQAGVITVAADAVDGTEVTVSAALPDGAATQDGVVLSVPVFVYDPALRPWARVWREVAQLDCTTGDERAPELAIQELRIRARGDVTVTWLPFEVYVDYWGVGTWDLGGAGAVTLAASSGNYVPTDIDGDGAFAMDGSDLVLTDLWLGTPRDGLATPGCGHRLQ